MKLKRIHLFLIAFAIGFILYYALTSGSNPSKTLAPKQRDYDVTELLEPYSGPLTGSKFSERINEIQHLSDGKILICVNGIWSVVNLNGEVLSKDTIFNPVNGNFKHFSATETMDGEKYAIFNYNGERLTDYIYDDPVTYIDDNVGYFYSEYYIGFVDGKGNQKLEPVYNDYYYDSSSKKFIVEDSDYKYIVYDYDFNKLNELDLDHIDDFSDGIIFARKDDSFAFYDIKGKKIIDNSDNFDSTSGFLNGYAVVYNSDDDEGSYYLIDKDGNKCLNINEEFDVETLEEFSDPTKNGTVVVSFGDGYALYSIKQKEYLTDFDYTYIDEFSKDGYAVVEDDENCGVIDDKGNLLLDMKYDAIRGYSPEGMGVYKDAYWFIVDTNGEPISKNIYNFDEVMSVEDGTYVVKVDDFYGLMSLETGELLFGDISPRKGQITSMDNYTGKNSIVVEKSNGYYGVIDTQGNIVIPFEYYYITALSDELFVVSGDDSNDKLVDRNNQVINTFDDDYYFEPDPDGEHFTITGEKGSGFIDSEGNIVVPPEYYSIGYYGDIIPVCDTEDSERVRLIDNHGKYINDEIYTYALDFKNGRIAVQDDDYYFAYMDKDGKMITDFDYIDCGEFTNEHVAWVEDEDCNYALIDFDGNEIAKLDVDTIENTPFGDVFLYTKDTYYGLVNSKGEFLTDAEYVYIDFSSFDREEDDSSLDYAIAGLPDQTECVLDKNGKVLIEPKYTNISFFTDGLARFEKDNKFGFIDTAGNIVIEPIYDVASYYMSNVAIAYDKFDVYDQKGYLIDKENNKIADISQFSMVYPFANGAAVAETSEETYLINTKGEILFPKTDNQ